MTTCLIQVGINCLIHLVTADEMRFAIDTWDSIVRGKTGFPIPPLPAFVQSLLDFKDLLNFEDASDATNVDKYKATTNGVEIFEVRCHCV